MNPVDFMRVFFNRGSKLVRARFGETAWIDSTGPDIAIRDQYGLLGRGATLNDAMAAATQTIEVRAMRTKTSSTTKPRSLAVGAGVARARTHAADDVPGAEPPKGNGPASGATHRAVSARELDARAQDSVGRRNGSAIGRKPHGLAT